MLSRLLAVLSPRLFGYVLLYLGRCAVATVHVAVEAPSFLSLQSCTRTLDRLYASTRSVYAKWYWVNHGRLTSEQSCTRTLDGQRTIMHSNTRQAANNHALEHSTGSERVDAFGLREMVLGKSRQAHQRTAGSPANGRLTSERKAYLPLPIVTHQSLDPAARALKRQASCLLRGLTSEQSCTRTLDRQRTIMHSNTRQARAFGLREMVLGKSRQAHQRTAGSPANAKLTFRYPSLLISTLLLERSSAKLLVFYASTRLRRAVEVIICMITRDFSVISIDVTRDFSVISIDVTGVSLSLSTTHKSHSRTI